MFFKRKLRFNLIDEAKKLNNYYFAMAIFRSIHRKIHGLSTKSRGVLAISGAGHGKSSTMQEIFDGLELSKYSSGFYVPSGMGTGIGLLQVLRDHPDHIIFIDELLADTTAHQNALKQIISGSISYIKYNSTHIEPFNSVVIAATNGIKLTKNSEHILAMLDRFSIIKIDDLVSPEKCFDDMTNIKPNIDWDKIRKNLCKKIIGIRLSQEEKDLIKIYWLEKAKESLDQEKVLRRQCADYIDWFLFFKQMNFPDYFSVARELADNTVVCNPVYCIKLSPVEKIIYKAIKNNGLVLRSVIINKCQQEGLSQCNTTIDKSLDALVINRIINRSNQGEYSLKR